MTKTTTKKQKFATSINSDDVDFDNADFDFDDVDSKNDIFF
jgi:hypothetical protein